MVADYKEKVYVLGLFTHKNGTTPFTKVTDRLDSLSDAMVMIHEGVIV